MKQGNCHHCGETLEFVDKVYRNDTCPTCGSDVYCCLNCVNYDESAPGRCREPQAEPPGVKDLRNFCEYFTLAEGRRGASTKTKADEAKRKLEALFKKRGS